MDHFCFSNLQLLLIVLMLQANPPDYTKIPTKDVLGVTVVLLTCAYRGQEFVRVGYFINNEYTDPELKENPPAEVQIDKVRSTIHIYSDKIT